MRGIVGVSYRVAKDRRQPAGGRRCPKMGTLRVADEIR